MPVEGDKTRKQFADLLDEITYQLGLGALANVWCAERVYAPALGLAVRDQSADAALALGVRVISSGRQNTLPANVPINDHRNIPLVKERVKLRLSIARAAMRVI